MLFQCLQERRYLQLVATGIGTVFFYLSGVDQILYFCYNQIDPELIHQLISKFDGFIKVVTGIHVQKWKGNLTGPKGFLGQPCHSDGVLSAGKHQHRIFKLCGNLSHNVDRFSL